MAAQAPLATAPLAIAPLATAPLSIAPLGIALLAVFLAAPALAIGLPPEPTNSTALKLSPDATDRMTVPVMIDGHGPYAFLIDTGANHAVISVELAASLHLRPGPPLLVHSASDARIEPSSMIATLQVGAETLSDVAAPALPRAAIGADGIIGVDALRGQAMVIDFRAGRMSIHASHPTPDDDGAVVVSARRRYGQLILMDATVGDVPVFVILDTGAETSVVNSTFRRRLEDGRPAQAGEKPTHILSVTGGTSQGQFGELASLTLGRLQLSHVPVVFSDLATFALFHLETRPAMLLGMDVMRAFDRVDVDYPSRRASFLVRSPAGPV